MKMEQQLVPGADGDAAVIEARESDEEEDNCMHQDDESLVESQNLSEKGKTGSVKSWSEVISRAQRRRDQRQLRLTDNQTKQAPSPSPRGGSRDLHFVKPGIGSSLYQGTIAS